VYSNLLDPDRLAGLGIEASVLESLRHRLSERFHLLDITTLQSLT
jgi:hypothetical protein